MWLWKVARFYKELISKCWSHTIIEWLCVTVTQYWNAQWTARVSWSVRGSENDAWDNSIEMLADSLAHHTGRVHLVCTVSKQESGSSVSVSGLRDTALLVFGPSHPTHNALTEHNNGYAAHTFCFLIKPAQCTPYWTRNGVEHTKNILNSCEAKKRHRRLYCR